MLFAGWPPPGFSSPEPPDEALDRLDVQTIDEHVGADGLGWYEVDGAAAVRIVHFFFESEIATSQQPIIEDLYATGPSLLSGGRMADLLTLQRVAVDGPTVVVDVVVPEGQSPGIVLSMLFQRETVFVAP